jgi:hypothetical protein
LKLNENDQKQLICIEFFSLYVLKCILFYLSVVLLLCVFFIFLLSSSPSVGSSHAPKTSTSNDSFLSSTPIQFDLVPPLVHLAKRFQRRRLKCEKLTDDRRRTTDANSSHCLWQSELKKLELQTNFGGP